MASYALGLDYGSDSVRALLVDCLTGKEVATHTIYYPRWMEGLYCDPTKDQFRQHPQDYIDSLVEVIAELWKRAPAGAAEDVVGISFDTTGSTPVPVNADGVPLALTEEFAENPNAMFVLWKDHTSIQEAAEITKAAEKSETNYLKHMGGIYSSEWFWAKALYIYRQDATVKDAAHSWVEHCDWMTALISGNTHPNDFKMGRCAAGHKIMWNAEWDGFPPNEFFVGIDPLLDGLVNTLNPDTHPAGHIAGYLTAEWAEKLNLPQGIAVGYGAFDCHMGAVAANVRPGVLTKVMGTSTCDITVAEKATVEGKSVKGICGQVDGSVLPGMVGLEAGQSAFGDLYAWFKQVIMWPVHNLLPDVNPVLATQLSDSLDSQVLAKLSAAAAKLPVDEASITALDWVNGRRTPDADQRVSMAITGLKMGSHAPQIFKALVEATAFGARAITERFREEGVEVNEIVTIGGISKKSDFVMQTCADVWNCQISVLESDQSCALGAAIFAAVAGGAFDSVQSAQEVMASPICKTYTPNSKNVALYDGLYARYQQLGGYVNGVVAE